jgi:hypothetical protein
MKVRADIAELIRAGHTNTRIAHQLGCSRGTVNRVRQALRLPYADALGRLYAEAHPRGVPEYKPARQPISPHRAAANRAELLAALAA